MSTPVYELKKFNPQQEMWKKIGCSPTTVIIGEPKAGKSFLIRDLLWYNREHFKYVCAISPAEQIAFYHKMMPHVRLCNEYYDAHAETFMHAQNTLARKQPILESGKQKSVPDAAYILDDAIHSSDVWKRSRILATLFMNARCMRIGTFFAITYPYKIRPEFACNIDYTFIFHTASVDTRLHLYKRYCPMIPSFYIFNQLMDDYTKDYGCLVINRCVASWKWQDMVLWYRGEVREDFTIGIPEPTP